MDQYMQEKENPKSTVTVLHRNHLLMGKKSLSITVVKSHRKQQQQQKQQKQHQNFNKKTVDLRDSSYDSDADLSELIHTHYLKKESNGY